MNFLMKLKDIDYIFNIIILFLNNLIIFYITLKIINKTNLIKRIKIIIFIDIIINTIICLYVKEEFNIYYSKMVLIILISLQISRLTKNNIGQTILVVVIALSFNYMIFFIAVITSFIFQKGLNIQNLFIKLMILIFCYVLFTYFFDKIKKLKSGVSFFYKKFENDYFNLLILNISAIIILISIILSNYKKDFTLNLMLSFIIFSIIMFITIQKSLQLYYKQKLLEQELDETKEELEKKKEEVKQLEAENLNFSKTSHSLAHKQKSLEYKLEQLKQKYEIAEEIELEDRIKEISKELYNKTPEVELSKTGITEIDDMLKYMQSECIKNKIDFKLQIKGNIYEMINNYVSKEDLTILLADHIKNAIIAIKYSENINKSILVRLGKIDKIYSLYIYDSGIEFEKETLSNLGKKPSTTHADSGGTGMGFMNTFDTLKKYNASLIINEYNKPCKDNYTKSIMIKFDKKQEFKINSYR